MSTSTTGTIVQTIGAVIDIEFPRDAMPSIYDALVLESSDNALVEKGLTFEVEQQLGDGVVRTIALGSADGLQRGMKVRNTGAPISVPVHSFDFIAKKDSFLFANKQNPDSLYYFINYINHTIVKKHQ